MQVKLVNKLAQTLTVSVLNASNVPAELKVFPGVPSAPIEKNKITEYTEQLVRQGHLVIVPA